MLAPCSTGGSVVTVTDTADNVVLVVDGVPTLIPKYKDCDGDPLTAGSELLKCDGLPDQIQVTDLDYVPATRAIALVESNGDTHSAILPLAANTSVGLVALATTLDYPAPTNNVDAATPGYVQAALNALPSEIQVSGFSYTVATRQLTITETNGDTHATIVPLATTTDAGLVELATAADYPAPTNNVDATTPAYVKAAIDAAVAALPAEIEISNLTYTAATNLLTIAETNGNTHAVPLPLWTETARGLVEMADDIEAGQDRTLGAGNLFSIAAPVGVLDDTRGMTPEKTYAAVRKNFFIDTVVAINLITDARFPTPQSVMNWLAGKRILSAGSVTINVPDGFHDFTGSGVMRAHPDSSKITWRSLTAPLPYSRADMVEVGATAASHSAAHAANYATLQGKFAAELKLPFMTPVDNQLTHGFVLRTALL
jgi:hypothetical protein